MGAWEIYGSLFMLNRDALLKRKVPKPQTCQLPGGGEVLMRVPKGGDYRAYQKTLRDKDGDFIDARVERGDELLIATLLIDPLTNERMFSVDDIMAGILDDTPSADINTLARKAYELYGRTDSPKLVTDEDREKNSDDAAPSE